MSSIQDQVRAAAEQNQHILRILQETDHAVPDAQQQASYIKDLERQFTELDQRLVFLEKRRTSDLKDHVKYRDSVFRRFAYKASGKKERFQEKANQEEKEYFEGLQETQIKGDMKKELESVLADARSIETRLQGEVATHRQAQRDLDNLYQSIFSGPTPAFPEEDQWEHEADSSLQRYHDTRVLLGNERRGVELLTSATRAMNMALQHVSSALSYSTWDMFGGGTMADMLERNELSNADRQWSTVQMLVQEAHQASPAIPPLPSARIALGSLISDVLFDNIFTDMAFHSKIEASEVELRRAAAALHGSKRSAEERVKRIGLDLEGQEVRLETARATLQQKRTEIFARISNQA